MSHSKLLHTVSGRLVVDANTITKIRRYGDRHARIIILSGGQGTGKSTTGSAMTQGSIVFPSGNSFNHTTVGIDVGVLEETDGSVSIFLDCEGLMKNESHLDQAQLRLVAALMDARHVHLAQSAVNQPVIQNLEALAHFINENRPGEKALLKVVLRTRRSGPQDESVMTTLRPLFNDFSIEPVPEVLTAAEPSMDPDFRSALTAILEWARRAEPRYICNTLADALERMIDAAGVPVPIATLCDQLLFPKLRASMDSIVTAHRAQIAALTAGPNAQLQSWTEGVRQELLAIIGSSGARLSAVGKRQMENEAGRHIDDLQGHWRHQVELHRVEAERRRAQDQLDLINQREKYGKKREATKVISSYRHTQGWRGGGKSWYGKNGRGCFPCCNRKENEGGCTPVYSFTIPVWNDGMFVRSSVE